MFILMTCFGKFVGFIISYNVRVSLDFEYGEDMDSLL